ncbi:hypothetical protein EB810_14930 [Altererythrobacter sp. FM1]|uniref:hypothetical protein n=1 Tax=Tsuneonella flava TaxID=2055955 RepID=UPI000C806916|nr:hypothetical protein [Tsuneonella flava]ROT93385.1 hypothetical protein EB810_14930 [Altererythrobacter sp. FM1]
MTKVIHPIAGALALLTIISFWLSTAMSELFGSEALVVTVKTMIPWGFLILIPALMAAGGSGFQLGKAWRNPVVTVKRKRMPIIAGNGIAILMPSALYLSSKAQAGSFDAGFYMVQAIELIAGAVNITLLVLNMRDGLKLTRKRSAPRKADD